MLLRLLSAGIDLRGLLSCLSMESPYRFLPQIRKINRESFRRADRSSSETVLESILTRRGLTRPMPVQLLCLENQRLLKEAIRIDSLAQLEAKSGLRLFRRWKPYTGVTVASNRRL